MRRSSGCYKCGNDRVNCICPSESADSSAEGSDSAKVSADKKSAVEILVFKPDPKIAFDKRGVHENLWLKQRFNQYLSVGIYLEGEDLQYYFWDKCDEPTRYTSLVELKRDLLKRDLPSGLKNIFDQSPELFLMGHGRGDGYGLGNDPVEIMGVDFDKIITDFNDALSPAHDEVFVTLEACNTDNLEQAVRGGFDKTFLERVSERHRNMTFCGTTPWSPNDPQTGYRASGGFPTLNAPITAMNGGIWKSGNSVIFYHDDYQLIAKKSPFASTQTAKELKVNTVAYAREVLNKSTLDDAEKEEIIKKISSSRDILKIEDLKKVTDLPQMEFIDHKLSELLINEHQIVEKEKNNYITYVQQILAHAESGEKFSDRDLLNIALGLKNISVFNGYEGLLDEILSNTTLLQLIMVTCGKVIIADTKNDSLINFLLERGIDINSADEKGMTALHYAAQNFYNYREEPLNLISKLLDCGANLDAANKEMKTPLTLATEHSRKGTVIAGENLLALLQQRLTDVVSINTDAMPSQNANAALDAAKAVETQQPNPSARDDASSIAVLTRGFGFISQNTAAQRAQLDVAAADSVDQKNDAAPVFRK